MIDISKINTNKSVSDIKKSGKFGSVNKSSFSELLSSATEINETGEAISVSDINTIDNFILIQEIEQDDRFIKRKLVKRAETLIEKLEKIRDSLLLGFISKEELIKTAGFIREKKETSSDPMLTDILNEIELRVEVELAKLTS